MGLEDPESKQTQYGLVREIDGVMCFCALGFLEKAIGTPIRKFSPGVWYFEASEFNDLLDDESMIAVIAMNDDRRLTLPQIAEWVREHVPTEEVNVAPVSP